MQSSAGETCSPSPNQTDTNINMHISCNHSITSSHTDTANNSKYIDDRNNRSKHNNDNGESEHDNADTYKSI